MVLAQSVGPLCHYHYSLPPPVASTTSIGGSFFFIFDRIVNHIADRIDRLGWQLMFFYKLFGQFNHVVPFPHRQRTGGSRNVDFHAQYGASFRQEVQLVAGVVPLHCGVQQVQQSIPVAGKLAVQAVDQKGREIRLGWPRKD